MADGNTSSGVTRGSSRLAGVKPADAASSLPRIGRFEIREVLGEGAFGRVYLGFDPELERQVAIKVPKPEGLTNELRERFVREARATARIHHPNVCPVFEVGTDGDVPYIVMHYLAGTTLAAHLEQMRSLPPSQAVMLAYRLALGVSAAHDQGVVHRDLKPQNILFDAKRQLVLITDFGLAHFGNQAHTTVAGSVFGTPMYMSPEQARGKIEEVGPLSDVYSLGVIFFRMLTGQVPFDGTVYEVLLQHCETPPPPPSTLRRGLDPRLDALVLRAMAKNPADRYVSAKDFAKSLGEFQRSGAPTTGLSAEMTHSDNNLDLNLTPIIDSSFRFPRPQPTVVPPPLPSSKHLEPLPLAEEEAPEPRGRRKVFVYAGVLAVASIIAALAFTFGDWKKPSESVATSTEPVVNPKPPEPKPPEPKPPDPPKPLPPSIANGFAGHVFDQQAERRAAAWVLSAGGVLYIAPNNVRIAKADELPAAFTVAAIEFARKSQLTDQAFAGHLAGLSGPLRISVAECELIGNETANACARIPKLHQLHLTKTPNVTDAGIAALAGHPTLEQLTLSRTGVTKVGITHVASLPLLSSLKIDDIPEADEWLAELSRSVNLTDLVLSARESYDVTERGLKHLKSIKKLRHLGLLGRQITDDWLPHIADIITLEKLDMWNARLEGPGLVALKKLPRLKTLELEDARIGDEALTHIASFARLESLNLKGTNVSDDGVRTLAKLASLKELILTDTDATAAAVRDLKKMLPKCKIVKE